jgi:hypothetical protein
MAYIEPAPIKDKENTSGVNDGEIQHRRRKTRTF